MIAEYVFEYVYDRNFLYQLLATLLTLLLLNLAIFLRTRWKRHQLFRYYGIPGPKPRLLDGSLNDYLKVTKNFKLDQSFYQQYGKVFGIFIGDDPVIHTADLDIIKGVFFDRMRSFRDRSVPFIHTPLSDGILFAEHKRWKFFRKLMSPLFSSYNMRGNSSTLFIEDSIRLMLEYLEVRHKEGSAKGAKQFELDIQDLMKSTALHMISSMAIKLPSVRVRERDENVRSLDNFLADSDKGVVNLAIYFPIFAKLFSFIAAHIEHGRTMALIRKCLNDSIRKGLKHFASKQANSIKDNDHQLQLLDILIKQHYEGKISYTEIIGNAEAILFAGYDTTSTTLAYVFWTLGKHQDVQSKLRTELMAHGVESKYLEQVLNEVMRLYPTVISFASRVACETVEINGLTIPQGSRVIYNSWLVHRNPEYWPNPDVFDPERFREGADIHPCAFAPFGLGDKKCLGYQLAKLEMRMICCDLLLRYRVFIKSPESLNLYSYAVVLTKPVEKIVVLLEKI